ncbi:MAG: N-acetyltransferase family protein [Novosphingobium sp.]
MTDAAFTIRPARASDAPVLAEIYAYHVLNGTATFEIEPPDAPEMAARLAKVTSSGAPWLVAETAEGKLLGYAYAAQFRDRPAYRMTCEDSVYIRHDCRGQGLGKALLGAVIEAATKHGFRQMIAVAGGGEPGSVALHASLGFEHIGRVRSSGRKFGTWLDTVYMQRALGLGDSAPPEEEPI